MGRNFASGVLFILAVGCGGDGSEHEVILGANGMFFDAEDRLHVASVSSGTVFVIDRDSGKTLRKLGEAQGVLSPDDVTIGADGTAYFTNILHGTVSSLSPLGEVRVLADLGWGVNSITLQDDGRVWVGRDFLGDGLYELDPTGKRAPRTVIESPGWINAMDFGPDGQLYGPVYTKSIVVRINPATGETTTVARFDDRLHAVKFDRQGRLHVVQAQPGRVVRVDLESGGREVVGVYEAGIDNLAFDSSGRLFISGYVDGSVHEVMPGGALRQIRPPSMLSSVVTTAGVLSPVLLLLGLVVAVVFGVRRWRRRARS